MAYTKYINKNSIDSHQMSPGYVLTFLRWSNRDTKNYPTDSVFSTQGITRKPMVVINDAVQVQISSNKSNYIHNMTAVLYGGDINYSTAIAPGDFVCVNMLTWQTDIKTVYDRALSSQSINNYNDGFKGIFKVQSVQRQIIQDPNGPKSVMYTVQASGFTEFNNTIYFNPAIVDAFREQGVELYSTIIGDYYSNNLKANSDIQIIIRDLFKILIGKSNKSADLKVQNYGNTHFIMPPGVAKLMGRPMTNACDLFNYIIGIWKTQTGETFTEAGMPQGFNSKLTQISSEQAGFYETGSPLQGNKLIQMESWNNATAWSIIKSMSNEVINEMYTAYRLDITGKVMPTVVVRQKPFTTEFFKPTKGKSDTTKFLSLPRWKISPDLLLGMTTGRQEASRFNFIQIFTRALADTQPMDMAQQIALGNFVYDKEDVSRHGLKPYVQTSNFDFPTTAQGKAEGKSIRAGYWAELVADMVIGSHLKESGTLEFVGIQEPIAIGDNLELDGIVYHIEGINHNMYMQADGKNGFRTTITVSNGVDARSEGRSYPVYPEMEFTDSETRRRKDFASSKLMPGFSDVQDLPGNKDGEFVKKTPEASFLPGNIPDKANDTDKQKKVSKDNK